MAYYDTFELKESRGDGSCFYSSLYRAARDHTDKTMLNRLYKIFMIDSQDQTQTQTQTQQEQEQEQEKESDFIFGVSDKTVDAIERCIYFKIKDTRLEQAESKTFTTDAERKSNKDVSTLFQSFYLPVIIPPIIQEKDEANEDFAKRKKRIAESYAKADVSAYTNWLGESANEIRVAFPATDVEFKKKYSNTQDGEISFYKDVATILKGRSTTFVYASQIDIDVVTFVLEMNDINLYFPSDKTGITEYLEHNKPTLWLHKGQRQGVSGNHYEYYKKIENTPPE
jgi:hypothetical protein